MSNLKNVEDINEDVTWLNFKGYDIRLEMSDYDNGNLTIRVTPDGYDDYTDKFTVVERDDVKEVEQ
tara:strand:- start:156 stop:353 length:198 start_codon:yes stop_codon:yes gene_type:complete